MNVDFVTASAAVGLVILLYRSVIKPVFKAANRADAAIPVLNAIAAQFKNNHGTTLKDTLDRIEERQMKIEHRLDHELKELENKFDELVRMLR